ncbi:hypothetical protein GCM10011608_43520 [Micromonospora sonchi]|uniref:Uncharacterized protein n=1 Tax=Micromonospora sonchi TaxID=1763543 RepID=A0A917U472_9ACTN|nr:hypothetical protein [Micromonospora sonchi]GGM53886.1 hypothetical protein GCM10011608_43520 [Micromonospora sonchi]
MKIDDRVESLVRDTIHAAVIRDSQRLEEQLLALADDETTRKALELTLALLYFLIVDIHGHKPSDAEVEATAAGVVQAEAWAQLNPEETVRFHQRLMNGQPVTGSLSTENLIIISFVSVANLLSSCRRDDEEWWNYLDRAEAALEAA